MSKAWKIIIALALAVVVVLGTVQIINWHRAQVRKQAQASMIQRLRTTKDTKLKAQIVYQTESVLKNNLPILHIRKQSAKADFVVEDIYGNQRTNYTVPGTDIGAGGLCREIADYLFNYSIQDEYDVLYYIGATQQFVLDCSPKAN